MYQKKVYYLKYHGFPLVLGNCKSPIHSDKKSEFDDLQWLLDRYDKVKLNINKITVHSMMYKDFYTCKWPK